MDNIYTEENFSNAYTELLEILQHIPSNYLKKIPKEKINVYIKNKNYNYNFYYDVSKSLKEQEILELTKILIANLYVEFWANEEERNTIITRDRIQLYEIEKNKKEKYNVDNLFKNKIMEDNNQKSLIIKKESIFKRFIDKIKHILKLT